MNFFEGYPFFLCLIPVLLAALLLGVLEKPLRWYSLAVSCLMIWMICRSAPEQMVYLAIFFFWEYGIIRLYLEYVPEGDAGEPPTGWRWRPRCFRWYRGKLPACGAYHFSDLWESPI